MSFFFHVQKNKDDKENSEQAWKFLVFFTFAPNSACL